MYLSLNLKPFVKEAEQYYSREYIGVRNSASIKYFKMLDQAYDGVPVDQIAVKNGLQEATIRNQLSSCEDKILRYLKIKELGRL